MRESKFVEGEFYHIYNRGNSKQKIFHDESDYERFLNLLYLSNTTNRFKFRDDIERKHIDPYDYDQKVKLVEVCFYALMPNHFHICTKGVGAEGIEKYMQKLEGAYCRYYNAKYNRTGTLFEGNFKAEHVGDDIYLKYLFSYIHLNPVKIIQSDWKEKGITNTQQTIHFLEKYLYSSFRDYLELNIQKSQKILEKSSFLKVLPDNFNIRKEIFDWLDYKN